MERELKLEFGPQSPTSIYVDDARPKVCAPQTGTPCMLDTRFLLACVLQQNTCAFPKWVACMAGLLMPDGVRSVCQQVMHKSHTRFPML